MQGFSYIENLHHYNAKEMMSECRSSIESASSKKSYNNFNGIIALSIDGCLIETKVPNSF